MAEFEKSATSGIVSRTPASSGMDLLTQRRRKNMSFSFWEEDCLAAKGMGFGVSNRS